MKIQKLQNYKPKDTRMAVPTHYTLLFDAYERNPKAGTDNHDIGNQHRRATCLAVLHIYQSIRKHPARFFSSCRVFSYAIQTQQKPESFLRIAFLFWVEFVNETNSSISKQVRPLNSTRMSFAFNINSITFSSCL